ncbi:DUF4852 domain-containing protein [Aeromonas veronii]|uniref:DUF4852 domain-containing protein n=1 Tax=Aeromonas veronii TaxID=654 RepID=A0A4S5C6S8_AERVE|nr:MULTISPECIES: DUF4852 domain-containing protein [Aeromonas]MCV3285857.1 DUF4852 domain-containing protein [Aeromonas veronii]THJ38348.1 DUF4852 domain-containing protein [Aeromonas veronii]TNH70781.1 hypothetical protein CF105_12510 [Aeromonas veronii]
MNKAKSTLLLAAISVSVSVSATDVKWSDMALYSLSQNKTINLDSPEIQNDMVMIAEPAFYEKNKNDEFAMEEKKASSIAKAKKQIAEFDPNKIYTYDVPFKVGKYNFETSTFNVILQTEARGVDLSSPVNLPIPMSGYIRKSSYDDFNASIKGRYFDGSFDLFFINPMDIKPISMKVEDAKAFSKAKGDDNVIYARISYVLRDAGKEYLGLKAYGQITKMEYFTDSDYKNKAAEQVIERPLLTVNTDPKTIAFVTKSEFSYFGKPFYQSQKQISAGTIHTEKSTVKSNNEPYFENAGGDDPKFFQMYLNQEAASVINKFGIGYIVVSTAVTKPKVDAQGKIGEQLKRLRPGKIAEQSELAFDSKFVVVDNVNDFKDMVVESKPYGDDSLIVKGVVTLLKI